MIIIYDYEYYKYMIDRIYRMAIQIGSKFRVWVRFYIFIINNNYIQLDLYYQRNSIIRGFEAKT